jgi:hypothetical protein
MFEPVTTSIAFIVVALVFVGIGIAAAVRRKVRRAAEREQRPARRGGGSRAVNE